MFYKVIKDDRVVDVLDRLNYVKYQPRHDIFLLCDLDEAQAVLSSDGKYQWHTEDLYKIPGRDETVELVQINSYEYEKLKLCRCKTEEEIIDAYTQELIEGGLI